MAPGSWAYRRAGRRRLRLTVSHAVLLRAIDGLPSTLWSGKAFRHVSVGRAPLSGEGARLIGGRWNPPQSFAVVYLGLSRAVVVAEFHRLARRQHLAPESFLPRSLHTYDVALTAALDLRDPGHREAVGLTDANLQGDDLSACRAVGEAAHACGREAVIAPGASGDGDVLAVFAGRLSAGSVLRDTSSELWETVPPVSG